MRIVAFITQSSVIDQMLTHLRTRASTSGPHAPTGSGTSHALSIAPDAPTTRGTCGVRGGPIDDPIGAANRSRSTPGPHWDRTADGPRAAPAGWRARDRPPDGVRAVDDHATYSIDRD